jgi:DNA-binding MarR family transcriptional regulator
MDKVTVSRATQALRERDFLKSTPNPNDGRSQLLTTTTAGRALYQRIMPQVQALDARIERHVGDDQVRELKALLDNVERAALSVLPL